MKQYPPNDYVGSIQGVSDRDRVYHYVILVRIDNDADVDSVAQFPGFTVVVDEDATKPAGSIPYRNRLVIRGLLKNIVGTPPEDVRDSDESRITTSWGMAYEPDEYLGNEFLSVAGREVRTGRLPIVIDLCGCRTCIPTGPLVPPG